MNKTSFMGWEKVDMGGGNTIVAYCPERNKTEWKEDRGDWVFYVNDQPRGIIQLPSETMCDFIWLSKSDAWQAVYGIAISLDDAKLLLALVCLSTLQ